MLADRTATLVACGLCLGTAALAEQEQAPDPDFLEYLGMWQESDEDWMLLEDMQTTDFTTDNRKTENDERSDLVPEGEESTETEDES